MSSTRKIAIGIGLAGSALLAAYLFTGTRKRKTQEFISRTGKKLKEVLGAQKKSADENHGIDYV